MKKTRSLIFVLSLIMIVIAATLTSCQSSDFSKAKELMESKKYDEAISIFEELGDYENSKELITECNYLNALKLFEEGKYQKASSEFSKLGDYKGSSSKKQECTYNYAIELSNSKDYKYAADIFYKMLNYKDSESKFKDCLEKYFMYQAPSNITDGVGKCEINDNYRIEITEPSGFPDFDTYLKAQRSGISQVRRNWTERRDAIFNIIFVEYGDYFKKISNYSENGDLLYAYEYDKDSNTLTAIYDLYY